MPGIVGSTSRRLEIGADALTHRDDGTPFRLGAPENRDLWVSATRTRNYVVGDPLLDWLDLYGEAKGFAKDGDSPLYDARTDFSAFVFERARSFEAAVVALLQESHPVLSVASRRKDATSELMAQETLVAMRQGAPIIHQGVLFDPEHRTYGVPDLLVRSDILEALFPGTLEDQQVTRPAPDLPGSRWHYRVVDVKFRTLDLQASGVLGNGKPAQKVQLFIYNQALGRIQGVEPGASYVLGRAWKQGNARGSECMERLGPVPIDGKLAHKRPISEVADQAAEWIRRVRKEGGDWDVLPKPSVPELFPDATNQEDEPWSAAKRRIANELEDLTLLWQVGANGRRKGHEWGITRWTDPALTPEIAGVTGGVKPTTLADILQVNTAADGPPVRPAKIRAAREEWHEEPALEFYVDFETVSDLADDFSRLPTKGGQPLIFMIGCGYLESGRWSFQSFVVDELSEEAEARIVEGWLEHMRAVRDRLAPALDEPAVIHWSPAETSNLQSAYNSAWERHGRPAWKSPRWFDFLQRVVREEPVVVRGSLAFGLKSVARAMHGHGLVSTLWSDGPADGLGAMVGAWWCQDEANRLGVGIRDVDLMDEIAGYNEVDCRVMMEIIAYLRENH